MTRFTAFALAAAAGLAGSAVVAQPPAPPPPPRPGVTWHGPAADPGTLPMRLERGFTIPQMFLAPQFAVGNWQLYGLSVPGPGQRWIRYYGDAYLIDGDGRIIETRADVDWDRAGAAIARRDGDRDHGEHPMRHHGDRDHGDHGDHGDHHRHHGGGERVRTYVHGVPGYPPPPPPPGYYEQYGAQGGYYGGYYGGYGYGYPIIVETTVWGSGGYIEEVTEEVEQVARPRRVRRARPCVCRPAPRPAPRRAAPRPPAGERG